MTECLLYARELRITDKISIFIPTVGQILEDEAAYNSIVTAIVSTPTDFMVQLDDAGIDFTSVSSFELFLWLFDGLKAEDTKYVFGSLDLTKFEKMVDPKKGTVVLYDRENDIKIDRAVHGSICSALRKINHREKNDKFPGNEEAKKYMLERARIKQARAAKKKYKSQLEDLIVAMVNTEQFKYGYREVLDLTIYQFNASVYQIVRKVNFDNTMIGVYAGTVNAKELPDETINWILSK